MPLNMPQATLTRCNKPQSPGYGTNSLWCLAISKTMTPVQQRGT